jgi:type II secretory pathway predicted ATPase ExeA
MYLDYFGLKKQPFGITPDTSLFFKGAERGDVLDAVLYALNSGQGIIKVVGEVGSGKTMLSRMLINKVPANMVLVYLLNPRIEAEQVLYAIAYDLGLKVDPSDKSIQILHVLQQKLLEFYQEGRRVVLVVDEAQQMPLSTLEEIRLLSNLETETEKLLQIILFGQPELDDHIDAPSVRQLRERITYSFYLSPLDWQMADKYLHFRLYKAGHQGRDIFDKSAIKLLTKYADGTLRRLNVLADKSMLAAFLQKSPVVETKHVKLALKDNIKGHKKSTALGYVALGVLFTACFFAIAYYLIPTSQPLEKAVATKATQEITNITKPQERILQVNQGNASGKKQNVTLTSHSKNLLQSRMEAFDALIKAKRSMYVIRLMSAPVKSADKVERFVRTVSTRLMSDKVFVNKTSNNYIVYYGGFKGYSQANSALNKLSSAVRKYKPYVVEINKQE